jgi:hypothetical protein
MFVTRSKSSPRRTSSRKRSRTSTTLPVRQILLGLTYQLHATRVVRILPALATGHGAN